MAQYLLKYPGVKNIISNRLCCQDQLEQFFGKQRQRGATNDNPNIQQFENNTSTLIIANSLDLSPFHGNCGQKSQERKRPGDISVSQENVPLPKRTRQSEKKI